MKAAKIESSHSDAQSPTPTGALLAKGQKWRIKRGDAEILHIGRTLVQYRFIKTGMVRGSLEMKSIAHFAEALKMHNAELLS